MGEILHRINDNGWRAWVLLAFCLSVALVYVGRLRSGVDIDSAAWALGVAVTLLLVKTTEHRHSIHVRVIDSIEFTAREADFLRKMAEHCVATNMRGAAACRTLIDVLNAARIPIREDEPVYGIFEAPENTPDWIKP